MAAVYNNKSRKVRDSDLYSFVYDSYQQKFQDFDSLLEQEKAQYVKSGMSKNVKYYKNFVTIASKLISKMKDDLVKKSQYNKTNVLLEK